MRDQGLADAPAPPAPPPPLFFGILNFNLKLGAAGAFSFPGLRALPPALPPLAAAAPPDFNLIRFGAGPLDDDGAALPFAAEPCSDFPSGGGVGIGGWTGTGLRRRWVRGLVLNVNLSLPYVGGRLDVSS